MRLGHLRVIGLWIHAREAQNDSPVRGMANSCKRQRTVQRSPQPVGFEGRGTQTIEKPRSRNHRPYRVGRRGADPHLEHIQHRQKHHGLQSQALWPCVAGVCAFAPLKYDILPRRTEAHCFCKQLAGKHWRRACAAGAARPNGQKPISDRRRPGGSIAEPVNSQRSDQRDEGRGHRSHLFGYSPRSRGPPCRAGFPRRYAA